MSIQAVKEILNVKSLERFPLRKLMDVGFIEPGPCQEVEESAFVTELKRSGQYRMVFANGFFLEDQSLLPRGVTVYATTEAKTLFEGYRQLVCEHVQEMGEYPFKCLMSDEDRRGVFITVEEVITEPIHIVHTFGKEASPILVNTTIEVMIASDARVSFIENYLSTKSQIWLNSNITLSIESGGQCRYLNEVLDNENGSIKTTNMSVLVKKNALFDGVCLSEGSRGSVTQVRGMLLEKGAKGSFRSLSLLKEGQSHWQDVAFYHKGESTHSHQLIKTMIQDRAFSSFSGRIDVDELAQQTDAYQRNENILLGKRAVAFACPCLEIRADDVKASHGCTNSELDKGAAVYLMSRGIDERSVEKLMIEGICKDFVRDEDIAISQKGFDNFIHRFTL